MVPYKKLGTSLTFHEKQNHYEVRNDYRIRLKNCNLKIYSSLICCWLNPIGVKPCPLLLG